MIFMNVEKIVEKYGITPNPDADQHFMIDKKMLKKIVSAAKLKKEDVVIEIGAGIGNLTKLLAKKAKKVYAIEKDVRFEQILQNELCDFLNVEIIIGDALKAKFPHFDKLVSNLPYQICEALVQKLALVEFKLAVVCVPKKFAERICAKAGDKNFSVLSIKSQAFFKIEQIAGAPSECFMPVPRVDSKIVRLTPRKKLDFFGYFLQEFLRENDKITKNAIRESLIFASENSVTNNKLTKRSAKEIVEKIKIPPEILEKRVFSLNEHEISSVIEQIEKSFSNY